MQYPTGFLMHVFVVIYFHNTRQTHDFFLTLFNTGISVLAVQGASMLAWLAAPRLQGGFWCELLLLLLGLLWLYMWVNKEPSVFVPCVFVPPAVCSRSATPASAAQTSAWSPSPHSAAAAAVEIKRKTPKRKEEKKLVPRGSIPHVSRLFKYKTGEFYSQHRAQVHVGDRQSRDFPK